MTLLQLLTVVFALLVVYTLWGYAREIHTRRAARDWPATEGVITGDVRVRSAGDGDYQVAAECKYFVGTTQYTAKFREIQNSREDAERVADEIRLAGKLHVRYQPEDPSHCLPQR